MSIQLACFIDGSEFSLSECEYEQALSLSSEQWCTEGGSVFTVEYGEFDMELSYDKDKNFSHQALIVYKKPVAKRINIDAIEEYAQRAFEDDDELVLFLRDNINIHIQKDKNKCFNCIRFVSNSSDSGKKLICTIMNEVETNSVIRRLKMAKQEAIQTL